jgi:hypothetical protein
MMTKQYFPRTPGGLWAASRIVGGRWIALIENAYLYEHTDAVAVLLALNLEPSSENVDRYFPFREDRGRCPTLELMELFSHLPPGRGEAIGV